MAMLSHDYFTHIASSYLLSPQTSPFGMGGLGSTPRLTLLGSPPPTSVPLFYKDADSIIFSEIAEFAMSIATPTKGLEPFTGFPHLQPFRLIRAMSLAEIGHVPLANRFVSFVYYYQLSLTPREGIAKQLQAASTAEHP